MISLVGILEALARRLCKYSCFFHPSQTAESAIYSPPASSCFTTEEEYLTYFNKTAQGATFDYSGNFSDSTEIENYYSLADATEDAYSELKEICDATASGPYFQYVGTVATVRDIVAMTEFFEGVGADVNYWGFS